MAALEAKWRAFAAIALVYVTIVFSSSMSFLLLTAISDEFGVTLGVVTWVVIIEALIVGAFLLPLGDLGDRLGRRRVLASGMMLFGLGCLLTGLAPTFGLLIVARIVTSIGNAMTQSIGTGLMVASFPDDERGLAMGAQTTAVAVGSASGPVVTGLLLQVTSWRVLFMLVAIPAAMATATVLTLIERDQPDRGGRRSIDIGSALLSALGVTLVTLTINNPFDWAWRSWPIAIGVVLALAVCAAYVRWELASEQPMLDLRLFHISAFRTGVNVRWLGFLAATTLMLLIPILLISVQGRSGGIAGIVLSCTAVGMGVSAQFSGRLYDRLGPKVPIVIGLTTQAAVFASLIFVSEATPWPLLAVASLAQGTAMGQWNVAANGAMLGAMPPESVGVGGAFTNVTRTIGNVFGQALASAVVVAVLASQGFDIPLGDIEDTAGAGAAFIDGWRLVCAIGAVVSLSMAVYSSRSSWDGAVSTKSIE